MTRVYTVGIPLYKTWKEADKDGNRFRCARKGRTRKCVKDAEQLRCMFKEE
jgi:hypothetical protein